MLGTLTRGTVEGLGQVCCHLKLEGRYLRNIYMELLLVETQDEADPDTPDVSLTIVGVGPWGFV